MKLLLAASACSLFLLAASADCAEWPKQDFVTIQNAPDTELCSSTEKAVQALREGGGKLYNKFRYASTRSASDLQIMGLSFHAPQTKTFTTVDGQAKRRTSGRDYYLIDIDNTPPLEMITFVSGGHLAAGWGDTLYILKNDVSAAPQPVAKEELANVALEIGPLSTSFSGQDFDNGYFIYPFSFQDKNYLLIEGNRDRYRKNLVAELVPGKGIVTHCYF